MCIMFDAETTGLPEDWNLDYTHMDNWPRAVQIAWQLHDDFGNLVEAKDFIIRSDNFDICVFFSNMAISYLTFFKGAKINIFYVKTEKFSLGNKSLI